MKLQLAEELVSKSGPTDPIAYYYRRWGIGWLYRRRIEMGLEMIPELRDTSRILEVGYGAGLVLYNLASRAGELHGLDLDANPALIADRLAKLGVHAKLVQGSVLDMRAQYPDSYFDLAVIFSTMEHLVDFQQALNEMDRVTSPGGYLLIGMPAVNHFMEAAFAAIGYKGINDHHVTSPGDVWRYISNQVTRWEIWHSQLPKLALFNTALYHTFLLRKRPEGVSIPWKRSDLRGSR